MGYRSEKKKKEKITEIGNTTLQNKQLLQKYRNVVFFLVMP